MSQVNQASTRPGNPEPEPICRAPAGASARAAPPVQARHAFDAALQLAPHVERLRDRLRQRQGRHSADFELEDEGGAG